MFSEVAGLHGCITDVSLCEIFENTFLGLLLKIKRWEKNSEGLVPRSSGEKLFRE